jgi:TonB-dependent starch-binding outer membrane protein SusC
MEPGTTLENNRLLPPPLLRKLAAGFLVSLAVSLPSLAAAQQTGSITGQVVDARNRQPLSAVQVFIVGGTSGALTGANGRFNVTGIPAGTQTVRAERIGYVALDQQVTVAAGAAAQLNIQLTEQALGLDAVVVTGTAGQARRREVGNTISQVNPSLLPETVTGVETLLAGRTTGMTVDFAGPAPGEAAVIRLRGITSTSQGNQPLVYVDGVRVRSEGVPLNQPGIGMTLRTSNAYQSSLGDINPADIERIEVIKGPAATTLYGTEAASGVIQIFTKRGVQGQANWTFETQQGFVKSAKFAPEPEPYYYMDRAMRTGQRQDYNLSVNGTSAGVSYFVSARAGRSTGILFNDELEESGIRGNFHFQTRPTLGFDFQTGFSQRAVQESTGGHNSEGIGANTTRCPGGCTLGENWERDLLKILDWEISSDQRHLISGLTMTWVPRESFTHRLTAGLDYLSADQRNIRPFGFIFEPQGNISTAKFISTLSTLDYVANLVTTFSRDVNVTWSAGAQYQNTERSTTRVSSINFPGPGVPTASTGATRDGEDTRVQIVSAGLFGQTMLGFKDRFFVTAGLRMDGYSAFGKNLGLEPYPKVSASYVISDEGFWPAMLGTMKLRGAYGWAGRAPGAFDAVRTWSPANLLGRPGFNNLNVGNPDLGPERSSEVEAGFDSEIGEGRVNLEVTYYRRQTHGALFSVRQAPSSGWAGSQLENVGQIRNQGVEIGINADVVRNRLVTWNTGLTVSTNKSETLSLGGAPSFSTGSFTRIEERMPAPVVIGSFLKSDLQAKEKPVWEQGHVFGPNYPTRIIGMNTALDLPKGITLSARAEYQGGAYMWNRGLQVSTVRNGAWFCLANGPAPYGGAYDKIKAGQLNDLTVEVRVRCNPSDIPDDAEIVRADFMKVRDISMQVPLPLNRLGVNLGDASLTVSAGNWFRWVNDEFYAFEPEIGHQDSPDGVSQATTGDAPPGKTMTASLRVRF